MKKNNMTCSITDICTRMKVKTKTEVKVRAPANEKRCPVVDINARLAAQTIGDSGVTASPQRTFSEQINEGIKHRPLIAIFFCTLGMLVLTPKTPRK
jgi:hypothetical protein